MAKKKRVARRNEMAVAVNEGMVIVGKETSDWLNHSAVQDRFATMLANSPVGVREFTDRLLIAFSQWPVNTCEPKSMFEVAMELSVLNLTPAHDHVALIPRERKQKGQPTGIFDLTYMVQFQGVKALIDRSEEVKSTEVVLLHNDDVGFYKFDPAMRQVIWLDTFDPFEGREFKTVDDVRGGYLVIKYTDDRPDKHVLVPHQVFVQARQCAQTKDVWDRFPMQQCHKTVYHYAFNRREVPVDPKVAGLMTMAVQQDYEVTGANPSAIVIEQPKIQGDSLDSFDDPESTQVEPESTKVESKQAQDNPMEPDFEEPKEALPEGNGKLQVNAANYGMFEAGLSDCKDFDAIDAYMAKYEPETDEIDMMMTESRDNREVELS